MRQRDEANNQKASCLMPVLNGVVCFREETKWVFFGQGELQTKLNEAVSARDEESKQRVRRSVFKRKIQALHFEGIISCRLNWTRRFNNYPPSWRRCPISSRRLCVHPEFVEATTEEKAYFLTIITEPCLVVIPQQEAEEKVKNLTQQLEEAKRKQESETEEKARLRRLSTLAWFCPPSFLTMKSVVMDLAGEIG